MLGEYFRCPLREATRDKKQLDFGFLLNRLDPPPPCIFGHVRGTFFSSLISSRQKFLKKFGFWSGPPLFLENVQTLTGKVPHKVWILLPPPFSLKMSKLKLKKGSLKSSSKALDSGWTPPPPSAKIQSRTAFYPLWLP